MHGACAQWQTWQPRDARIQNRVHSLNPKPVTPKPVARRRAVADLTAGGAVQ